MYHGVLCVCAAAFRPDSSVKMSTFEETSNQVNEHLTAASKSSRVSTRLILERSLECWKGCLSLRMCSRNFAQKMFVAKRYAEKKGISQEKAFKELDDLGVFSDDD